MIYEDFEVVSLLPVKYELAEISVKSRAEKSVRIAKKRNRAIPKADGVAKAGGVFDMMFRQCLVAFMILLIFTAINFVGFNDFMDNLKEVVQNRNITDFFIDNVNFV